MTIRLETEHIKGKASCLPIQEELNDNPYLSRLCQRVTLFLKNYKYRKQKKVVT